MSPVLIGIVVVLALIAVALIIIGQRRTRTLHEKFGSEYDRTLRSTKDRGRAEAELLRRTERVEALKIRPLALADRTRFEQSWEADQARFVDDPRGAVKEADRLVADLMQVRGYPIADFEQRAADISVDHPNVVSEYRAAHDIATRDARNLASTEDLRMAMVHYRALFNDLLIGDSAPFERTITPGERIMADHPETPVPSDGIVRDRAPGSFASDRVIPDRDDARPEK